MGTTFEERIIEIDHRISILKRIKDTSNNHEGFNALISNLEEKRVTVLSLKGGDAQ